MPFSTKIIRLINRVDEPLREILISILEEIEQQREETVTKKEFNELKEIVKELSKNVKSLAQAQRKTEERLNNLAKRVDELAQAQKRTEQRLNELAEAQKKTEEELKKLIGEHKKTREQLGGLSHTVGYILEDRAYVSLPYLLEKDHNIHVHELKRDYIEISKGKYIEINIIGDGMRNKEEVVIIGECKTQLKKKDVDNFIKTLGKLQKIIQKQIFPVIVTYQALPPVRKYVKEQNIPLYFSYQLKLS